ncbi:MAG: TIGR01777 family oxidoreductase [Miltoncostaeaceae bacterium]
MVRIAVVGASGLIGGALARALLARGDEVVAVSRSGATGIEGVEDVRWDPAEGSPPPPAVTDVVDAVVNLAGAPLAEGRWTAERKRLIRESRVQTTTLLARVMGGQGAPQTLINGSAVGYYGVEHGDEELREDAAPGDDFLGRTCVAWEEATAGAARRGARVVLVRTGLVLDPDAGLLPRLVTATRLMAGGPLGGGRQWMPWIHIDDEVAALLRAIDDDTIAGPLNACAPNPVRQREFARTLGRVLGRPAVLPAPAIALRLAMGEMSTLALDGQRAVPGVLSAAHGFSFRYPELEAALRAALGREEEDAGEE